MRLLITNEASETLIIMVYPKSEFLHNGVYRSSDFGAGFKSRETELKVKDEVILFSSENINQSPHSLCTAIFDSICIYSASKEVRLISFSEKLVMGYKVNLFDSNNYWNYSFTLLEQPNNTYMHTIETHDYRFNIIKEDLK